MDTREFLARVLPPTGIYHARWFENEQAAMAAGRKPKVAGTAYVASIEELADLCIRLDTQGLTVYYGTATYAERGREASADNVRELSAYRLDLDVGDGPKKYATKQDALQAAVAFVKDARLPEPTFVSSGAGLHLYWCLKAPVPRGVWLETARKLKDTTKRFKLRADPAVTADPARILRPVGVHHRKTGRDLLVRVGRAAECVAQKDMAEPLGVAADVLAGAEALAGAFEANSDMVVEREYPPSDPHGVARNCQIIREMRDTRGDIEEPLWYRCIGVLKHCVGGEEVIHEWSQGYDGYSAAETDAKIEQWAVGPTSCEELSYYGDCEGCPHKGRATSPIELGRKEAEIKAIEAKGKDVTGPWWPKSVGWDESKEQMYHMQRVQDDDGVWHEERTYFSTTKFYVETRIWADDSTWAWRVHRLKYVRGGVEIWEPFTVPTKFAAKPAELAMAFAAQEVYVTSKIGPETLAKVLKDYGDELRTRRVETVTHSAMGWHCSDPTVPRNDISYASHADGFIIGNKLIREDSTETVLLSDSVPHEWRGGWGVKGTAKEWASMVHKIYVKTRNIPMQFVVLSEFASPLAHLFGREEYHGTPISLFAEGGLGKTSVCHVAASIWGPPGALTVSGNPVNGDTQMTFQLKLSVLHSIGLGMDEATLRAPAALGELAYCCAMGKPKGRLGPNGKPLPEMPHWWHNAKFTANKSMLRYVADVEKINDDTADAIQKRLFEIDFGRLGYRTADLKGKADDSILLETLKNTQYGTVGPIWARYLLKNKVEIMQDLVEALNRVKRTTVDFASERFHDYTQASIEVTCKHVHKCGLMFPDVDAVMGFVKDVRGTMSETRNESRVPVIDAFARYLAQHQNGLLHTDHFPLGKGRTKDEYPKHEIRGEIVGRVALQDHFVALAIAPLKDWCVSRAVDFNKLVTALDTDGYLKHDPELQSENTKADPMRSATARLNLARGTALMGVRTNCLVMDFGRMLNKASLRVAVGGEKAGAKK
jgi:hypothetical protein